MKAPLKIAVAGLGTVGAEVVRILSRDADLLAARAGRPLVVTDISARNRSRDRGVDLSHYAWHDDAAAMASSADVDIVVELVGGADGPAHSIVQNALAAGHDVVTANKAMLAKHGVELAAQAERADKVLAFEAAVAGGIPIVKALREGLAGNRVSGIYGILNGTCNFILTTMRETGRSFADVLKEAQDLGYAEADPAFDIDGNDAGQKLAIMASIAFGIPVDEGAVYLEGITSLSADDIAFAEELGYRIKLLGIARRTEAGIEQRVHPVMIDRNSPLGQIEGVTNAVEVAGSAVGTVVLTGPGAGAGATASAVVADLVDIAAGRRTPTFGVPYTMLKGATPAPMDEVVSAYYLRLMVWDRPGVIAGVTSVLGRHSVSLESMLQRGRNPGEVVPVVMVTHECREAAMRAALAEIADLDAVVEPPTLIRIEGL
ncbi:MAG: homoserine dehydrogenase [Alphaproteobacteria bacterium]|nr:homoserine dehydrogenase [Alphaproteobacteria bacterium]MCB9930526.1 homoserine dehydrogenase [Alphaproteobacteria bacterium]